MTTPGRLMAAGIPPEAARQIGVNTQLGLTAAGTTKADATAIIGEMVTFTTVASATGALLPPASALPPITIYNGGVNALLVYANGTQTINALATASGFSVAAGKAAIFMPGTNIWLAVVSA